MGFAGSGVGPAVESGTGIFARSFRDVRVGLLGLGLKTAHCCASYNLLGLGRLIT